MEFRMYYVYISIVFIGKARSKVHEVPYDAATGMNTVVHSWFPDHIEFDEGCVMEGCPGLRNVDLDPSDVDINRLQCFFKKISDCMKESICGIVIDPRPMMSISISADEFLPDIQMTGTATTIPCTGQLSNVSNIKMELSPQHGDRLPLQFIFLIPDMKAKGIMELQLSLSEDCLPVVGQEVDIHLPNVSYEIAFKFSSTVLLNRSSNGSVLEIEFVNPIVKASYQFCGMEIPPGYPTISETVTTMSNYYMENSNLAKAMATLFKKLYQSAISAASKPCRSLN